MLIVFVLCLAATICALGLGQAYVEHLGGPSEDAMAWWQIALYALAVAAVLTALIAGMAAFIGWLHALAETLRGRAWR